MSGLSLSQFDADLALITADLPTLVTWAGAEYQVIAGDVGLARSLEMEGLFQDADLLVVLRVALLAGVDRPRDGETLVRGETTYRIDRVESATDDVSLMLFCVEEMG